MSQNIWGTIVPTVTSGSTLANLLTAFKNAVVSGYSGTSRPANLQTGGMWIDTTNSASPNFYYSWMFYTGTTDIEIFRLSVSNNFGGFSTVSDEFDVKHVGADTTAAIMSIIKNRVASNGQVLNGDVVAEIRMIGTTLTGTNPTVAYLRYTSTDDETTSAYGGTLSLVSIPDATSTLTEHLRFIGGQVEASVALKLNSLLLVSQNVATTASIAQLSASKAIVEMTGSTATDVQGINSAGLSQLITIHNRSSAAVTFKHENASAIAADRFKLPKSSDILIPQDGSATFYYCTADSRWKVKDIANIVGVVRTSEILTGVGRTWTAPSTTRRLSITCYPKSFGLSVGSNIMSLVDAYGNEYGWGFNGSGQLGVGDVVNRSSPVATLGGLSFLQTNPRISTTGKMYNWGANSNKGSSGVGDLIPHSSPIAVLGSLAISAFADGVSYTTAITRNGTAYAWGLNVLGCLGVGDLVSRSSPVAVLGGLLFAQIATENNEMTYGLTDDGTAYAWGQNSNGSLGTGDGLNYSSPVAVFGGLKFSKLVNPPATLQVFAMTNSGDLYAWGDNTAGSLGIGIPLGSQSSPILVLGGLKFINVWGSGWANFGITSDGTAYAWGNNISGQLGVGDRTSRSSPVAILGGLKFRKINTFSQATFGLTVDGALYAWGDNISSPGMLGVGDIVNRSSPVAVLGGLKFIDIANNGSSVTGLTADGQLYSWGTDSNSFGLMGTGSVFTASSPIAVLGPIGIGAPVKPKKFNMDVTPGATYKFSIAQSAKAFFGTVPLDADLDYIIIEYLK